MKLLNENNTLKMVKESVDQLDQQLNEQIENYNESKNFKKVLNVDLTLQEIESNLDRVRQNVINVELLKNDYKQQIDELEYEKERELRRLKMQYRKLQISEQKDSMDELIAERERIITKIDTELDPLKETYKLIEYEDKQLQKILNKYVSKVIKLDKISTNAINSLSSEAKEVLSLAETITELVDYLVKTQDKVELRKYRHKVNLVNYTTLIKESSSKLMRFGKSLINPYKVNLDEDTPKIIKDLIDVYFDEWNDRDYVNINRMLIEINWERDPKKLLFEVRYKGSVIYDSYAGTEFLTDDDEVINSFILDAYNELSKLQ